MYLCWEAKAVFQGVTVAETWGLIRVRGLWVPKYFLMGPQKGLWVPKYFLMGLQKGLWVPKKAYESPNIFVKAISVFKTLMSPQTCAYESHNIRGLIRNCKGQRLHCEYMGISKFYSLLKGPIIFTYKCTLYVRINQQKYANVRKPIKEVLFLLWDNINTHCVQPIMGVYKYQYEQHPNFPPFSPQKDLSLINRTKKLGFWRTTKNINKYGYPNQCNNYWILQGCIPGILSKIYCNGYKHKAITYEFVQSASVFARLYPT